MSRADWQSLVRKYCPEGKRICNCGDAYYTLIPNGAMFHDGEKIVMQDSWQCEYGCSTAQIEAREHVAACVVRAASSATGDK